MDKYSSSDKVDKSNDPSKNPNWYLYTPFESNFWIRLLEVSATYMLPTESRAIPTGYSKEDISEEVMSALTKNYSALMKKIDEKKGRR